MNEGFTQEYMAEQMNLSQSSYSRLESGTRGLKEKEIRALCKILKISSDDLLGMNNFNTQAKEPSATYNKPKPKMRLTIEFTEDDVSPDGELVKRLNEMIRKINAQ